MPGDELLEGDGGEPLLGFRDGAGLGESHRDCHRCSFEGHELVFIERCAIGQRDDLAVLVVSGTNWLTDPRCSPHIEPVVGIGGNDDGRVAVGIEHGDRTPQQVVQGGRDLCRATAGKGDLGEQLVDLENPFQALPLCFEQGVEDGGGDVGDRGTFGKRDHWQRQPVGRDEQLGRELVPGVEANGEPGYLRGVEPGDEMLPFLARRRRALRPS